MKNRERQRQNRRLARAGKLQPRCDGVYCFAYFNGSCRILTHTSNNSFTSCPFFKTKKRIEEEQLRTKQRLAALGLTEKIKQKYGGVYDEQD